jgi:DNA uptake protein ComE-like DNA-binding protein
MGKLRVDPERRHVVGWALIALGGVACAGAAVAAGAGPDGAPAPSGHASAASNKGAPAAPVKLIDINSASRAQLKTLPGIGDAEADKIVAGRPYLSKARLVTEAGLPVGIYLTIKNQIVAMQNKETRAKLKALAKAQQAQQAQPR